jgi:hypothetical protein
MTVTMVIYLDCSVQDNVAGWHFGVELNHLCKILSGVYENGKACAIHGYYIRRVSGMDTLSACIFIY